MQKFFLGLDASTQSLSSILLDLDSGTVLDDRSVNFDQALPAYRTSSGVVRGREAHEVGSYPLMWVEALDLLFEGMRQDQLPLEEVLAISGSGQQHGSVYLNDTAASRLAVLDPKRSLADHLKGVFTREISPVWMDSSTGVECGEIRNLLGGKAAAIELTGSDVFERFTGAQIRKFSQQHPEAFAETAHIALVSSFMSSILCGRISPMDVGDGAGMNLMDLTSFSWSPLAIQATARTLGAKLPPLVGSETVLGPVSPYFVHKYGLHSQAQAVVWSGDNPCSLIGTGLVEPGMMAISLGTSDTLFGAMADCHTDPRGEGHVFGSPAGGYMTLICFKNGSLARERVKDYHGYDWDAFSEALRATPPGNGGSMMLPWFEAEIVPRVNRPGVRRHQLDPYDGPANCRACVEAQMLSMRLHSAWMGEAPQRIYATGGASSNPEILRVMADVHNAPVFRQETANGAALGAALRAAHAWAKEQGDDISWKEIVAPFTRPVAGSRVDPDPEAVGIYNEMIDRYKAFEEGTLKEFI